VSCKFVFSKFHKIARVAKWWEQFENFEYTSEVNPHFYEEPLQLLVYNIEGKIIEKN
jgi:hypothetical protein